jgi:hypothetical protein
MTQFLRSGGAILFVPLLFACAADSTGPGDDDEVSDRIVVSIESITVIHDCDPATDNPGDFQAWVEIWQDADPAQGSASHRVAASPKASMTMHPGEYRTGVTVEARVARVSEREVEVGAFVRQLMTRGAPST